jgi:hypothetical protein
LINSLVIALTIAAEVRMKPTYRQQIAVHVEAELGAARGARSDGDTRREFAHLERAHVLGQESTYWHVKVHVLMLLWGIRQRSVRETLGQVFRIIGAATKTAFGLVPEGNTGGSGVSPFKAMPIEPDLAILIGKAKL